MKTISTVSRLLPLLALGSGLTILASCQTPTTAITKGVPDVCLAWKGISYSAKSDTPETVQGVRQNNAARDSYCERK